MGARANLIIVTDDGYELYYDHWCATSLDHYAFWGESANLDFIKSHTPCNDCWLDTVWCEGGMLIDTARKVLVFFGGESDIAYNPVVRGVYFDLLGHAWPGYTIQWAANEIADLAEYVGIDRNRVINEKTLEVYEIGENVAACFADNSYTSRAVCTVRLSEGQSKIFVLNDDYDPFDVLFTKEPLLDYALRMPGQSLSSVSFQGNYPESGIHIDIVLKKLSFWWANRPLYDSARLALLWPGWEIESWRGDHTRHLEAAGPLLRFPEPDIRELTNSIYELMTSKMYKASYAPDNIISGFLDRGYDVQANPVVYDSMPFVLSEKSRENHLRRVFSAHAKAAQRIE